jgi:hypothetical protein
MHAWSRQGIARHGRRWTRTCGWLPSLVGSLVACLLVASASPVAAYMRPVPGGLGDLVRGDPWSGWHVRPPIEVVVRAAWPQVTCERADTAWHAGNVAIRCDAFDAGAGLANPADASFTLSTGVPAGASDANASTGMRVVCNAVGNCRTAPPVSGIRVDRVPPEIHATVDPLTGPYAQGSIVRVEFTCMDTASGIRSCPPPANLVTTSPGFHTVSFQAIDAAGNASSVVIAYAVRADRGVPMIIFPDPRGELV